MLLCARILHKNEHPNQLNAIYKIQSEVQLQHKLACGTCGAPAQHTRLESQLASSRLAACFDERLQAAAESHILPPFPPKALKKTLRRHAPQRNQDGDGGRQQKHGEGKRGAEIQPNLHY
jgi:hypothetical protein